MYTKLGVIQYPAQSSRSEMLQSIESIAAGVGMTSRSQDASSFDGITDEDLSLAFAEIFSHEERLRMADPLKLRTDRLALLRAKVPLLKVAYARPDGSLQLSLDAAEANQLPVLARDTWIEPALLLFGLFFQVSGANKADVAHIDDSLRALDAGTPLSP